MDYYSPWSSKNLINWNRLTKFMQVGVDVTYIYNKFGGCGPSGFKDTVTVVFVYFCFCLLLSMVIEKFN